MTKHTLILIVLISLVLACNKGNEKVESPTSELGDILPTIVKVKVVQKKPFEFLVHTSGKIRPQVEAEIFVRSDGMVNKVLVNNGDIVSRGQILAELENDKQKLDLEKAQAILTEKKIDFEDQKLGFSAAKDSTIRKAILENIRYTTGLVAAELAYKQAAFDLEQTRIKSPIDGLISSLLLREHNPVNASQPAAFIFNPGLLLVECLITETDALLLRRSYSADVTVPGNKNLLKAHVLNIDQRVDEKTNLVRVQLKLTSGAKLIPGMSVEVIIKAPNENAVLVPKEAVVIKNGKSVVFTEEAGLAKWNYVLTGRENGKEVEILNGLATGKQVIITNNLQLAHDAPVQIAN